MQKPLITYPMISLAWEPMMMSNGDLLFNNIYGRHARISNIPHELEEIINLCDGTNTIEKITYQLHDKGYGISVNEVRKAIEQLSMNGIVIENLRNNLPPWMTPEIYERFYTLMGWFDRFDSEGISSIDIFQKLRQAKIGIVGLGGTGSLIAMMLASSGIGSVRLIDGDKVDISNLVRQIFYNEEDVGKYKVDIIRKRLMCFFSDLNVETIPQYINNVNEAKTLLKGLDFVFLEADAPRIVLNRWINEACTQLKIPYIYSFSGQIGPIYIPDQSACFTCLENHIRSVIGQDHDVIVEKLQKFRTRKYPSFISGVTLNSHFQFNDAIACITKAFEPLTKNAIIRLKLEGEPIKLETIPRDPNCPSCGNLNKSTLVGNN